MERNTLTRRQFLGQASAGTFAAVTSAAVTAQAYTPQTVTQLAVKGGQPVRTKAFPAWPPVREDIEQSLLTAFKSRSWCRIQGRANMVKTLEKRYAELIGTKRCVATGSGTQAIHTAFGALGLSGGHEVLVVPHTYIGSVQPIFIQRALPIFVDIDIETFQMDPVDLEKKIGEYTWGIEPVHISGWPCDMDRIMAIAKKHNLFVVEDACQAHLAAIDGKNCGTFGDLGCFSFQSSKALAAGEGGAVVGDDDEVMDKCYSFQNLGTSVKKGAGYDIDMIATKYRMNELEGALLVPQLDTIQELTDRKNANADYLTKRLEEVPGIIPQKPCKGVTRRQYYLYGLRYKKEMYNNVSIEEYYKAVRAEGIPLSRIYSFVLNKMSFYEIGLNSPAFKKMYSKARLDRARELNYCPNNDKLATEEGLWLNYRAFLGTKSDIDDIVNAFVKVYENRNALSS